MERQSKIEEMLMLHLLTHHQPSHRCEVIIAMTIRPIELCIELFVKLNAAALLFSISNRLSILCHCLIQRIFLWLLLRLTFEFACIFRPFFLSPELDRLKESK